MSKFLCSVVESYRVDSVAEADELIAEARTSSIYELKKSNIQKKEVKQKGEIIDEFYLLTLTKDIQSPKEPEVNVDLEYEVS